MDCAFVGSMFPAAKVGRGEFAGNAVSARPSSSRSSPVMAMDAFQRKFATFGNVQINYTKNKRPFEYKSKGSKAGSLAYPVSPAFSGVYAISLCDKKAGVKKIMAKAEEFIANDRVREAKKMATSGGIYNTRCTEGAVPLEAEFKRVFNRTNAFREAQKPINVRLNKAYNDRRMAFILADGMDSEEKKISSMPLLTKVTMAAYSEGRATCSKYATPFSMEENYIMKMYMNDAKKKACPNGEYKLGCQEGTTKGQAEALRVAVGSGLYRNQAKSASDVARFSYDAPQDAMKFTAPGDAKEGYYNKWASVASAVIQD